MRYITKHVKSYVDQFNLTILQTHRIVRRGFRKCRHKQKNAKCPSSLLFEPFREGAIDLLPCEVNIV